MFVVILVSILLAIAATIFSLLWLFVAKVLHYRLDLLSRVLVGLLVLQFILGMLANLFATIPTQKSYTVYQQFGSIPLHAINGVLVVLLSVIFLIRAIREKKSLVPGIVGVIGTFLAYVSGTLFVIFQQDILSFTMAIGFISAMLAYTYKAFSSMRKEGI